MSSLGTTKEAPLGLKTYDIFFEILRGLLLVNLVSCGQLDKFSSRQNKVNVKNRTNISSETWKQIGTDRTFFQSRSVITLKLDSILTTGLSWSLVNNTTSSTVFTYPSLAIDNESVESLQLDDGQFIVRIYPSDLLRNNALVYGANSLEVVSDSVKSKSKSKKKSDFEITVDGFTAMGGLTAHLPENVQASDGFQGWINPLRSPVVVNDGKLVTGIPVLVND